MVAKDRVIRSYPRARCQIVTSPLHMICPRRASHLRFARYTERLFSIWILPDPCPTSEYLSRATPAYRRPSANDHWADYVGPRVIPTLILSFALG